MAAALLLLPGRASAEDAAAESLFREGKQLLADGKIAQACDALDASNRIEPRAGTLILLGECREKNNQFASAWSAFADAKTRAKDPAKKEMAMKRAAALEPRLSYLTVSVPDESRIEGLVITRDGVAVDPGLWNRAVPVDGKKYHIVGKAPGHEPWATDVMVPLENGKATIDVPKFKQLLNVTSDDGTGKGGDTTIIQQFDNKPVFSPKRIAAASIAGAGLVAVGVGVVFGIKKSDLEDKASDLCPNPSACPSDNNARLAAELTDQAKDKALVANIMFAGGGALLVGATVLWIIGGPEAIGPAEGADPDDSDVLEDAEARRRIRIQPTLTPAYVGVDLSMGF